MWPDGLPKPGLSRSPPCVPQLIRPVEVERFGLAVGVDTSRPGWWHAVDSAALGELTGGLYHAPGDPQSPKNIEGVSWRVAMAMLTLHDLLPAGVPDGYFLNVSKFIGGSPTSICATDLNPAAAWIGESEHDTYFCLSLLAKRLYPRQRVRENRAAALLGVSMDFDCQASYRKRFDLFEHVDQALEALQLLPAPRLIVHTGGGLQPVWSFRDPLLLNNEGARAEAKACSVKFQQMVGRIVFDRYKVVLDSTADLARLVRAPGSLNCKTDPPSPTSVSLGVGEYLDG